LRLKGAERLSASKPIYQTACGLVNWFIFYFVIIIYNINMNIGHSSRLPYDTCAYDDRLAESVSPLLYKLNPTQIANKDACLSTLGPRGGKNGYGVSLLVDPSPCENVAPAQNLVDLESVLSNRNVPTSRCKTAKVNPIDVTQFGLKNTRVCDKYLDPVSSRLTYPAQNYRSIAVNRFHDLPVPAQEPIFWDFAVNTRLEAKDNFREQIPNVKHYDPSLVAEIGIEKKTCKEQCSGLCPRSCLYNQCK
jgi:hypothetical protein